MRYIQSTQNQSGAYPPAQEDWFPECIPLTDEQADMLVRHNGFVSITSEPDPEMEGSTVTVVPNTEAWEAWKSSLPPQPEPEPTEAERLRAGVDFLAAMTGVEL